MHRCVARAACAAGHARLVSLRRGFTTSARLAQRHAQSNISQEDLSAMDDLASHTIRAAGEGSGWPGWKQSSRDAENSLWRGTQRSRGVVSEDKERFMADSPGSSWIPDDLYGTTEDIYVHPGSFVELRRNGIITLAVLIRGTIRDGKSMCISLTASGEIYEHIVNDIFWVTPNFMSVAEVEQCGLSEVPDTPAEHAARVHALRRLRDLDRTVGAVQTLLGGQFASLYDRVRNKDPSAWTELKTADAAAMIMPKGMRPKPIDILAVHRLLMDDAMHYIAHPHVHRVAQTYLVWPLEAIQTYELVTSWCRERANSNIASFLEKAKTLLQHKHNGQLSCPPAARDISNLPTFDENDKTIIRFLRYASYMMRKVQSDLFIVSATKILKQVGFFQRGVPLNRVHVFEFLKAIGVIPPWENDIWTRPHMFVLSKSPPAVTIGPESDTKTTPQVTPRKDEFYPTDLAQALRHDFGDQPVYVIDDSDAKELDDGVAVERIPETSDEYWLHVHIADPTRLLHPEHKVSQFAREMASTAYFRNRTWPMLPSALTFERFSLGAPLRPDWPSGKPVETITFSARVNDSGVILDTKVQMGQVRNVVVVSYDQADLALGPPYNDTRDPFRSPQRSQPQPISISKPASEDLRLIERLSHAQLRKRTGESVFSFYGSSLSMKIPAETEGGLPVRPLIPDEPVFYDGYPHVSYNVTRQEMGRGRMLVSECMILACRVASRAATALGVPILRRAAPAPQIEQEYAEEFQRMLESRDEFGRVDLADVLRCGVMMSAASYTLEPAEHGLLGIPSGEGYVRATSPLRRYLDLVSHWQLKIGLLRAAGLPHPTPFSAAHLRMLAAEQGARETEMQRAMSENERFWAVDCIRRMIESGVPSSRLRFSGVITVNPELNQRTRELFTIVDVRDLGLRVRVENVDREHTKIGDTMHIELQRTEMEPPTVFAAIVE